MIARRINFCEVEKESPNWTNVPYRRAKKWTTFTHRRCGHGEENGEFYRKIQMSTYPHDHV